MVHATRTGDMDANRENNSCQDANFCWSWLSWLLNNTFAFGSLILGFAEDALLLTRIDGFVTTLYSQHAHEVQQMHPYKHPNPQLTWQMINVTFPGDLGSWTRSCVSPKSKKQNPEVNIFIPHNGKSSTMQHGPGVSSVALDIFRSLKEIQFFSGNNTTSSHWLSTSRFVPI